MVIGCALYIHYIEYMLRYDNRVVIVTGAGNGIGKEYALFFAERGAKVVVNDLGTSTTGSGKSSAAADSVVQQILSKGGQAIANYDSVQHGDKIIQTAIDTFGRVDVLINNAGILRDISFQKMSDRDWHLIMQVHLYGTFNCTKAAWKVMRSQNYGRIINTCSDSALFGQFGQVNYCSAKMAILGMTLSLAREGAKNNIMVNCISPKAASRMLQTVRGDDIMRMVPPRLVVPFVGYLAHEGNRESGGLYSVGGGYVAKIRWQRSEGSFFDPENMTPEQVKDKMKEISDFNRKSDNPSSAEDTFGRILSYRNNLKAKL